MAVCEICDNELAHPTARSRANGVNVYCCDNLSCQEDFADFIDNVPYEAMQVSRTDGKNRT